MTKKTMSLQRFAETAKAAAEAVQGKQLCYLYRPVSDKAAAYHLAMTTENSTSISKDASTTSTKDGMIRTPGAAEIEITATSILTVGDVIIGKLREAMLKDELIEVWEVNLAEPGQGANKFKGTYYMGYLTNLEISSPSDGSVEVSLTIGVNGQGVAGDATVDAAQQEEAMYAFKDTVAVTGA